LIYYRFEKVEDFYDNYPVDFTNNTQLKELSMSASEVSSKMIIAEDQLLSKISDNKIPYLQQRMDETIPELCRRHVELQKQIKNALEVKKVLEEKELQAVRIYQQQYPFRKELSSHNAILNFLAFE